MSGTSLDGLDLALCEFRNSADKWNYRILKAETIAYDAAWHDRLSTVHRADAKTFWKTHVEYGHYLGKMVSAFLDSEPEQPELIASHGHTVFHLPDLGFTMQLGAGEAIAAETGLPVICDFRSGDVALGGQGAPLVPAGDRILFGHYGACLNIGGITNVSYELNNRRIAYDICPSNIVLNHLAMMAGKKYDQDGILASQGNLLVEILESLSKIPYYRHGPPKSLGREWIEEEILPLILNRGFRTEDLLRTMVEHIAIEVSQSLDFMDVKEILVTGGGAFNRYLIERMRAQTKHSLVIPDPETVNYKEALVFALLGVLKFRGEINVFSSVTGSRHDHCGGVQISLNPHLTKN